MVNVVYQANGRLRGHFVYALLCGDAGSVYVKIGNSHNPLSRLESLRTACPMVPHTLAIVELISRREAMRVEVILHEKLRPFRTNGEWFKFERSDKPVFNAACAKVFASHTRPNWELRWQKLKLSPLFAAAEQRRRYALVKKRRQGLAYSDAVRHGLR